MTVERPIKLLIAQGRQNIFSGYAKSSRLYIRQDLLGLRPAAQKYFCLYVGGGGPARQLGPPGSKTGEHAWNLRPVINLYTRDV